MQNPLIKSQNTFTGNVLVLVVGAIVAPVLAWYVAQSGLRGPYWQFWPLAGGVFLLAISAALLWGLFSLQRVTIYKDKVELHTIFGSLKNEYYLSDITDYMEVEKSEKGNKWQELSLFTNRGSFTLSSKHYSNYQQLKSSLTHGKAEDAERKKQRLRDKQLLTALAAGLVACVLFYVAWQQYMGTAPVKTSDLRQFSGVITNQAEISRGSKGARWVTIYLKEYPGFKFEVTSKAIHAFDKSGYVSYVTTGDTLTLSVNADEYQMKLSKEKEPSFEIKHNGYSTIEVYELSDARYTYMSLDTYNARNTEKGGLIVLSIFGACALGLSLWMWVKWMNG
jgi:hypothetical protein